MTGVKRIIKKVRGDGMAEGCGSWRAKDHYKDFNLRSKTIKGF